MERTSITYWSAIELFCRLICAYEKDRDITNFSNEDIRKSLLKYDDKEVAAELIAEVLGAGTKRKYLIYDLTRSIKEMRSIEITQDTLDELNETFDDLDLVMIPLSSQPLSDEQRDFENTNWWIYHFDETVCTKHGSELKICEGVTRAWLRLGTFGKAYLNGFSPEEQSEQRYLGSYILKNGFLVLSMANKKHSDLNIRIFVEGNDNPKLALGHYNNYDKRKVYAGTVMMLPFSELDFKKPDNEKLGKFFDINENRQEVPDYVWDFFALRSENYMSTTCKVNSINSLQKLFMKRKLAERTNAVNEKFPSGSTQKKSTKSKK